MQHERINLQFGEKNAAAERRKTAAAQEDKIMEEILHLYKQGSREGVTKNEKNLESPERTMNSEA
jgi:hypothetical protein